MRSGFPSMTALLGLLAIAGYQNRDKLAEMLGGMSGGTAGPGTGGGAGSGTGTGTASSGRTGSPLDGILGGLTSATGGTSAGSVIGGGLGELFDRFRQTGHADTMDSWVGTGPNKEVAPPQLEQAIGPDVLATLSAQTGLSREELLARLSRELPRAVDQYTPRGRLPTREEFDTL